MPGRNISILLNLIYFENLFRDIGFSSSYCFVPVYLSLLMLYALASSMHFHMRKFQEERVHSLHSHFLLS